MVASSTKSALQGTACLEEMQEFVFFSGILTISIKESLSNFKETFVPSDEVLTSITSGTLELN